VRLSWDPALSLSEAISALVLSLALAVSATTDPAPSLATVKNGLESILAVARQNEAAAIRSDRPVRWTRLT
jgi:hypothetical protein